MPKFGSFSIANGHQYSEDFPGERIYRDEAQA